MSAPAHLGDKLSAYLDGELPASDRAAADQHLRDCASCAQLLEELAAVDAASRALAVEAPEGYFDAFPARVRQRLAVRRVRRIPAWTWAAAAALLLAVVTPLTLRDRPAPVASEARRTEEATYARTAPAAPAQEPAPTSPPPTLSAEMQDRLRSLGYVGGPMTQSQDKERAWRQKQDAARDLRLRERDGDVHMNGVSASGVPGGAAGGVVGGIAGAQAGRRGADLTDGGRKKEAFADKAAADQPNQNAPTPAPTRVPPAAMAEAVTAEEQRPLAARADESAEKGKRAQAAPAPAAPAPPAAKAAAAPPPAEAPQIQTGSSPAEGSLRAAKAKPSPARGISADEGRFEQELEALASRPLANAEDARAAARQWDALARRHPQSQAADEARVRAVEAWATAFRLEHKDADRDQARKAARTYLDANGPQKDRVRAVLDQLAR